MTRDDPIDRLIRAAIRSDEEFVEVLTGLMEHDLRIGVRELSERSGVAASSLYKILSGARSPNLSTFRAIVRALRKEQAGPEEAFIGLIAARPVLDVTIERSAEVDGRRVNVREYPAHSWEDAVVAAVRAEREGASAIVCAPVVSRVVEQLVRIPVATIIPRDSVQRAIELAARKAWL
jgi:predicted transcriptional regulator